MASTRAVVGGLLEGAGRGLVAQAEQKREAALEQVRQRREDRRTREDREFQLERDELAHERAIERNEAQNEQQGGLIHTTRTDVEGQEWGITRNLEVVPLGIQTETPGAEGSEGSDGGGSGDSEEAVPGIEMTAGEMRTFEEIKEGHTDNLDGLDRNALISDLRSRENPRFHEIADLLAGEGQTPPRMSEEEARAQAQAEADQRTSMVTPREQEFPETNGDMDAWIEQRTRELMGETGEQDTGGGQGGQGEQRPRSGLLDGQSGSQGQQATPSGGQQRQSGQSGQQGGGQQTPAPTPFGAPQSGPDAAPFGQPQSEAQPGRSGQAGPQPLPIRNGEIDAAQLVVGQIYDTPRGNARYLGNGEFESVN